MNLEDSEYIAQDIVGIIFREYKVLSGSDDTQGKEPKEEGSFNEYERDLD